LLSQINEPPLEIPDMRFCEILVFAYKENSLIPIVLGEMTFEPVTDRFCFTHIHYAISRFWLIACRER
jgi:hypothetical protein